MYQLAQVNIARMLAPLDDPLMAGFVAKLDEVNALADNSPGFVWRFQTPEGNATAARVFEEEQIIFNMSVWSSVEDFSHYVYAMGSEHRNVMKQRRRWFEPFNGPFQVLWWIPQDHIPTIAEAKEHLDALSTHGETAFAFTLKHAFPAPDAEEEVISPDFEECRA